MLVNTLIGANGYQPVVAAIYNYPNPSGATNAAVTVSLSLKDVWNNGLLPGDNGVGRYTASVTPSQACFASVTNKTTNGFNVVLTPLSGNSIAAGTFDVLLHG
jgi:hypothetical protein